MLSSRGGAGSQSWVDRNREADALLRCSANLISCGSGRLYRSIEMRRNCRGISERYLREFLAVAPGKDTHVFGYRPCYHFMIALTLVVCYIRFVTSALSWRMQG